MAATEAERQRIELALLNAKTEVERNQLRQQQKQNDEKRATLESQKSTSAGRPKPPTRKPSAKPCDCPPGDPLCSCLD